MKQARRMKPSAALRVCDKPHVVGRSQQQSVIRGSDPLILLSDGKPALGGKMSQTPFAFPSGLRSRNLKHRGIATLVRQTSTRNVPELLNTCTCASSHAVRCAGNGCTHNPLPTRRAALPFAALYPKQPDRQHKPGVTFGCRKSEFVGNSVL